MTPLLIRAIDCIIKREKIFFSCSDLVNILRNQWEISVSRQLVHTVVTRTFGYSFKRTRKRGAKSNQAQLELFSGFLRRASCYASHGKLAAVDECGFDQRCNAVYAYAPRGTQAVLTFAPNSDRRRITMVTAICQGTGSHHENLVPHSCSSSTFADFLTRAPFPPGTGVILDNAAIHKTREVQAVARRKRIALIFIPPYTPEANPIEMLFGTVKSHFYRHRYECVTESYDLSHAILKSMSSTNATQPRSIRKMFSHSISATDSIYQDLRTRAFKSEKYFLGQR